MLPPDVHNHYNLHDGHITSDDEEDSTQDQDEDQEDQLSEEEDQSSEEGGSEEDVDTQRSHEEEERIDQSSEDEGEEDHEGTEAEDHEGTEAEESEEGRRRATLLGRKKGSDVIRDNTSAYGSFWNVQGRSQPRAPSRRKKWLDISIDGNEYYTDDVLSGELREVAYTSRVSRRRPTMRCVGKRVGVLVDGRALFQATTDT